MIQREFRPSDVPRLVELLGEGFPQEEALLGTRPQQVVSIARRIYRWDARLLLGVLRAVGRPVFRFLVVEEDGRLVATTLLNFAPRTGWVSMVVVDPAYRRRGFARVLLERARELARRAGKGYVALDVLQDNAPALELYRSLGYAPLRSNSMLARESPFDRAAGGVPSTSIRPFERTDARRLVEIVARTTPSHVAEVLPMRASSLTSGGLANRLLLSDSAAWVLDRGDGAEAHVAAVVGAATRAAHLSSPIVGPRVDRDSALALLGRALAWVGQRGSPRAVAMVPEENAAGRAALLDAGFRDALPLSTLYRQSS